MDAAPSPPPTDVPSTATTGAAPAGDGGLRHASVDSPVGVLRVVVDADGSLAGLYLPEHRPAPRSEALGVEVPGPAVAQDAALAAAVAAVLAHLDGAAASVAVPVAEVAGTEFQRAVWARVAAIPYGETATYGQLAAAVGRPTAVRAVGAAIARNPVCLAVPCHRVVATGGAVTGYAGGVELKRWLLDLEASHSGQLTAPAPPA